VFEDGPDPSQDLPQKARLKPAGMLAFYWPESPKMTLLQPSLQLFKNYLAAVDS